MGINYANIFNSKSLQSLPKFVFLVLKYNIWQPCCQHQSSATLCAKLAPSIFFLLLTADKNKLTKISLFLAFSAGFPANYRFERNSRSKMEKKGYIHM
jgi:hypothetical protein